MKISYNWLQDYFKKKLPKAEELAEQINAHSFEIESVENAGADIVFDVKVMPDRAHYALCHKGIAREVRAITCTEMNLSYAPAAPANEAQAGFEPSSEAAGRQTPHAPNTPPRKDEGGGCFVVPPPSIVGSEPACASFAGADPAIKKVAVSIQDKNLCHRYVARRIENIKITESPQWLKDRLEAIGSRVINSIVDATNYVMFDVGQPLHAFDADKVEGGIVVRKAGKGEIIELLPESVMVDGKLVLKDRALALSDTDLIIADDIGPIAIAGVKGGKRAEISGTTKNIILESANFNPVSVRRTSTRLNIRNDASKRFENEIIPELAEAAMNVVTDLILKTSPGASAGPVTDECNRKTEGRSVSFTAAFISEKLGKSVKKQEIEEILRRVDCEITERDGEISATPPLDRLDLAIPEDFADEVARIMGYDSIKAALPPELDDTTTWDRTFYWSEKVKNVLINLGFSEVMLYSLAPKGAFEIEYPLASDKAALRQSIIPKMKESLKMNILNADLLGLETVKIFEIGKVFPAEGEKTVLAIGVAQVNKRKGITSLSILNVVLKSVFDKLGTELNEKVLNLSRYPLESPDQSFAELDFDAVVNTLAPAGAVKDLDFKPLPKGKKYLPFSPYPFIVRDIAVFVPQSIRADDVWRTIESAVSAVDAKELLVRHSLFDTFKKDERVSYAFRMIFQSMNRTLTDEEVGTTMEKIYAEIKEIGWEVR